MINPEEVMIKTIENEIEKLGLLVDRVENFIAAGSIPMMPDSIKLQALEEFLPDLRDELKEVFFGLGGDKDTWS